METFLIQFNTKKINLYGIFNIFFLVNASLVMNNLKCLQFRIKHLYIKYVTSDIVEYY